MTNNFSAFRLGDIRGLYPDEIDEDFVHDFAHAFVGYFKLEGKIATGRDMRRSSDSLQSVLNETLSAIGIDVINIGLCPTELGYFASGVSNIEAAIVVTASHNPAVYNGLKCVRSDGQAITNEHGLNEIRKLMLDGYRHRASTGSVCCVDYHGQYLDFLCEYFPPESLQGGQIALNGLNGTAASMAGLIASEFELPVTWFRENPGPIPDQGADPSNPRLVKEMKGFMSGAAYSLGVAWDGDCDRCVFFDAEGDLIPTYYVVGLLAEKFLIENPGGTIVFDTKLCWNTLDIIAKYGGKAVPAETGHAFMKEKMHRHNAVYGGELSSHHYFGDFYGCDSGMFAWLSMLKLLNESGVSGRELIEDRRREINCTPEITLTLTDIEAAFGAIEKKYGGPALQVDRFDGLGFTMPNDWRFSLRRSKTEPVVRVNFESRKTADALLTEGPGVFDVLEAYRADDSDWLADFRIQ